MVPKQMAVEGASRPSNAGVIRDSKVCIAMRWIHLCLDSRQVSSGRHSRPMEFGRCRSQRQQHGVGKESLLGAPQST